MFSYFKLERIKNEGLGQEEIEDAKRYLLGNMAIEYQKNGSQAMSMALDELYGLGYDHHQKFIREIETVARDDILRTAQRIIAPHGYVIAMVGPSFE